MKRLLELGDFVRNIYLHRRFGQLSPLHILRVEIRERFAECDWLVRSSSIADAGRSPTQRGRNASLRTLEDALAVRELIFCALPGVESAILRVYRRALENQLELIVAGTVKRGEQASRRIRSLAMKGKLCGLQFRLSEEGLEALQAQEWKHAAIPEFSTKLEFQRTEEVE